ncbi:hypothetical protein ACFQ14_04555 [Pseudahrensia aquimaris]|uniref:Uncharacterized protein n=1 Tax=Pseudahrensia aquimaris TaxID=744461 RepID=A0ABW3FB43_9HYPH
MVKSVLILGSAPDAVRARDFDTAALDAVVALNNAWQIIPGWSHAIYPEDFPDSKHPSPSAAQRVVTYEGYVPANNAYGGIVYAGGTMAFTAGYWALATLRPDVMMFCGCDMVYDHVNGKSHFYGCGEADPLRKDPTLQSLKAKANRLMLLAASQGCAVANLSDLPKSRLTFPSLNHQRLSHLSAPDHARLLGEIEAGTDVDEMRCALAHESHAEQFVESGDYWNAMETLDPAALRKIDRVWERAFTAQDKEKPGNA